MKPPVFSSILALAPNRAKAPFRAIALRSALLSLAFSASEGLGATPAATTASEDRPPNVLLIIADDLNVALGCYGNAEVKSPNIDRLAARGIRFDRAYCQYPLCNPSRVSFLSGRRPETSGVYVLSKAAHKALPEAVMLPRFFRDRGYFTAGVGKVFHSTGVNDERSWDFYEDGPGRDPQELAAIKARNAGGGGDGRPAWHILDSDGSETRDGLTTRSILGMMREQHAAGRPFFLAAGFRKPHLPWTAPRRFFDLYPRGSIIPPAEQPMRGIPSIAMQTELSGFDQPSSRTEAMRGYYACISFIDDQVGQLLDELERLDLWKTTVVLFMSDNGFHLGDHDGLWAKLSAFDAATRVPLIVAGAGVPSGQTAVAPVELLDIYPTLLQLTGLGHEPGLEGTSLLAKRAASAEAGSTLAHSMVFHYDVATGRDVLGRTAIAPTWRYTEWSDAAGSREFYWRPDDPGEFHNRFDEGAFSREALIGRESIGRLPAPKPGPANRPRALVPPGERVN